MTVILELKIALSSETESLFEQINAVCSQLSAGFFIAGATAREVLLHHVYGRKMGRRTRDIDIAVFVESWQQFNDLKEALVAQGATRITGNAHRLEWHQTEIDIIPFGNIVENNRLTWPPEHVIVMSVDGFQEAFANSVNIRLSSGCLIPFCTLPGLTLLKIFAWRDRRNTGTKDALDLYTIINTYGKLEDERIYEEPIDIDFYQGDPDRMGAFLLGNDIAHILCAEIATVTIPQLQAMQDEKLIDDIASQYTGDSAARIEQLVEDFWAGVAHPK